MYDRRDVAVDIRVPLGRPPRELADFIARCERAGFDGVGIHDHHQTGWDAYVVIALALSRTSRLRVYPATSNPVTRHPLVLAALANSLADIAPGRSMLTLATGFRSVEAAGVRSASRSELRSAVAAVRSLLAGEPVQFGETVTTMRNRAETVPPVCVLASGPRLLELAGEVADVVMMLVGLHPAAVAAAREHVRVGAMRAGRDPASIREMFIVPTAVDRFESAREWPRRWFRPGRPFLTYPSLSNLHWLRMAGIDLDPDHHPLDIPPELASRICEALGLFGPPEHCAERLLRAREEAGVQHVFLFPSHTSESAYELPEAELAAFARVIRPRLRARTGEGQG
ncbi:MAG TPA: LLM class flavin-dependent oxidoreductase [Candidatus Dormibacteraeota bacterium]|nr:LLM class flavin-dependent oxidoreductase [Candidatus Dormibacteraeota bacterium]